MFGGPRGDTISVIARWKRTILGRRRGRLEGAVPVGKCGGGGGRARLAER